MDCPNCSLEIEEIITFTSVEVFGTLLQVSHTQVKCNNCGYDRSFSATVDSTYLEATGIALSDARKQHRLANREKSQQRKLEENWAILQAATPRLTQAEALTIIRGIKNRKR